MKEDVLNTNMDLPIACTIKQNMDGSTKGDPGPGGFRGLLIGIKIKLG